MKRLLKKAEKPYLEILKDIKNIDNLSSVISRINNYAKMYKGDQDEENEKCYYDDFIKFVLRVDSEDEIIFNTLYETYDNEELVNNIINKLSVSEKEDLINYLIEQSTDSIFDNFEI